MDEEALRQEITARIQAEYEVQLREVKRQKGLVEEELERGSERSRTERRRLNAEIDRLEEALNSARRSPSSGADSKEVQQAVEEKLRRAAADWQAERERLTAEVARLEGAFTEAIARSSNPNRATQTVKDTYEIRLAEANRLQLEAERDFMRAKAAWGEEKSRLTAELVALRRGAPAAVLPAFSAARSASIEETRIRDLEGQLNESRSATQKYHAAAMKSAQELTQIRKEVLALNSALLEIREQPARENFAPFRGDAAQNHGLPQEFGTEMPELDEAAAPAALPRSAEVARVQAAIAAIENLFDDPNTVTSTIARKIIEKGELEAYLRGILFSAATDKDA